MWKKRHAINYVSTRQDTAIRTHKRLSGCLSKRNGNTMSKTEAQPSMHCERCATDVTVTKDNKGKLKAACACNERYIRVKKILPGGWNL